LVPAATHVVPLCERTILAPVVRHARTAKRLRLEIPAITRDERIAASVIDELRLLGGGLEVRANRASGRVVVTYADGAPLLDRLESAQPRPTAAGPQTQTAHPFHGWTCGRVLAHLESSRSGLDEEEARARLTRYGTNEDRRVEGRRADATDGPHRMVGVGQRLFRASGLLRSRCPARDRRECGLEPGAPGDGGHFDLSK